VNQVNDAFRYPYMKKPDPEPVFPRQRWCYFCPYRKVPESPGGSDVILHLAKNVSERRADLILAWTSLQTGLSLVLSVESGIPEHWPCVSFVSHGEFSFAGCWKAEDSWPTSPEQPFLRVNGNSIGQKIPPCLLCPKLNRPPHKSPKLNPHPQTTIL
jgi:hypothetical protein